MVEAQALGTNLLQQLQQNPTLLQAFLAKELAAQTVAPSYDPVIQSRFTSL